MLMLKKQSGFTLVEIIVVIAIMGIIGGLSALIIGRSLDAYAALERREKLQTSIRLAVERISREVRKSLPNSICVHDMTSCVSTAEDRFYFIPVKDSGRYQDRPGSYPASGGILRDRLPVAPLSRDRFDVLSTDGNNRLDIASNDWIVVYNLNNIDVYNGTNNVRNQVNAIVQKDINNTAPTADDIDQIQFSGNQSFANHSPSRRFHIIENNNVTLFYLNGTDLFRATSSFAAPNTPASTPRLLMENVQSCTFTYTPGSPQRAGLLKIDITVSSQGEQVQVIHNAHIYYTP